MIKNSALITHNNEQTQLKLLNRNNSFFSQSTEDLGDQLSENANLNQSTSSKRIIQKVFKDNTTTAMHPPSKARSSLGSLARKTKTEIHVESSYQGVEIKFPITKQNFHDLVNSFKLHKPLHAKYAIELLEETIRELKKLKNINLISTSTKKQITVVGDLHGSLDDLLIIFYKVENIY